jgi:DNA-binding NarL/FixJ family response regulator
MAEPRLRVFVVDDHDLFRAGVRAAIGDQVEIIGEADDVDPAVELIRERVPDVVLLDVHLPGGGGHRVVREVIRTHPAVRFLALSVSDAPQDVVAVIRAGASGYLTKTATARQVVEALRLVAGGHAVFSPQLAGFVLEVASHRQGLHLPGGGRLPRGLPPHGGNPRLRRVAQAPAHQPQRADPVGGGPGPGLRPRSRSRRRGGGRRRPRVRPRARAGR